MRPTKERLNEIRQENEYAMRRGYNLEDIKIYDLLSEIDALRELGKEYIYQHACRLEDECKKTKALTEERDQLKERVAKLREAMKLSIARSDDYADSYCSQPIRQAFAADHEMEGNIIKKRSNNGQ